MGFDALAKDLMHSSRLMDLAATCGGSGAGEGARQALTRPECKLVVDVVVKIKPKVTGDLRDEVTYR